MVNTIAEFNKRVTEIDLYFLLVKHIDNGVNGTFCELSLSDIRGNTFQHSLDINHSTMLKANGFLLLYNLTESTVRNCIDEVFSTIISDSLSFIDVSEKLRKIWVEEIIGGLKEGNYSFEKLREKFLTFSEDLINRTALNYTQKSVPISGNIDAQKIREISDRFGIAIIRSGGEDLLKVKTKRNDLAHGVKSFYDIGKDYTFNEMDSIRVNTITYLRGFLSETSNYIAGKQYK